jgi:hypothetical protein
MRKIKDIFNILLLVSFLGSFNLQAQCDLPAEFEGNTGANLTVLLTADVISGIEETVDPESFYVVAHTPSGLLVGSASDVVSGQMSIAVWGDDTLTPEADGATDGEALEFQVVAGTSLYDLEVTSGMLNFAPTTSLTYITNGIASVSGATISEVICQVEGCTNETACNYNADATVDNGSCLFVDGICETCVEGVIIDNDANDNGICDADEGAGCMDETACNYNDLATEDDGSCTYADEYYDCDGNCLNDVNNNGICDETETEGCIDETACNYNENATLASSCIYVNMGGPCASCSGETDGTGTLVNNDVDEDGICDEDEIEGCLDETACNYNPDATDDGACEFAVEYYDCEGVCLEDTDGDGVCDSLEIYGCTDENYFEYDSLATELDMDSCITMIVNGCTDMESCNYNELANQDDGSCYSISVLLTEYSYEHQSIVAEVTGGMFAEYEWTLDGEALEGETNNEVIPVDNGEYEVTVTDGLCVETLSQTVSTVSVAELELLGLELYPNPTTDVLNLQVENSYEKLTLKVLNSVGAEVMDNQYTNIKASQLILLDVESLPNGIYMLKVYSGNKSSTIPWMKY